MPTFKVPPTASGTVGSKASPATNEVTKLLMLIVVPEPLVSVAGDATLTTTSARPAQLYGVVVILKVAALTVPPGISTTPPVAERILLISTVTVPAAGAAMVPKLSDCIALITRFASQLAGFGGQAGGHVGPPPIPIVPGPAGAAKE